MKTDLIYIDCPTCNYRHGPIKAADLTASNKDGTPKMFISGCPQENQPHQPHRYLQLPLKMIREELYNAHGISIPAVRFNSSTNTILTGNK